jgi:hypothetical protein
LTTKEQILEEAFKIPWTFLLLSVSWELWLFPDNQGLLLGCGEEERKKSHN